MKITINRWPAGGLLLMAALAALAGCSAQQAYYGGQAWQRNECINVIDPDERQRCINATQMSFAEYRSQPMSPRNCSNGNH